MKILAAPDLHCYWPNYCRTGEDGTPSRLAAWRKTAEALVEAALEHEVSAVLFPGDIFAGPRPSPQQVAEILELFLAIETTGIRIVACAGNHDVAGAGQMSAVELIGQFGLLHERRWGIVQPGMVHLEGLAGVGLNLVVLPATKIPQSDPDPAVSARRASEQLTQIARSLVIQAKDEHPNSGIVVMGHWAISGCSLAAGNVLAASEPTLPIAEFQSLGVDAVVMGHIHKPQVLSYGPLIVHTGVLERHDFGEEDVPCGCYVLDLARQEAEFVELPARRFFTLRGSPEMLEMLAAGEIQQVTETFRLIKDAVVRVVYRATEEQAKRLDHGAIIRALEAAGAHQVAGVYPEIIRSERARAQVTETTSPLEALDKWLSLRSDLSEEVRQRVRNAAGVLMKEVA